LWLQFSGSPHVFGSVFLEDGLYLPNLLFFFGTMSVGYIERYTVFLTKTLVVWVFWYYFLASMYLSLIGGYVLKAKNPFQGSSTEIVAVESKGRNYHRQS